MQSAADQALQAGKQLVDAPPEPLTRLVRMVARAFYSGEHAVIIDYLCKRTIIREEDMAAMFRLDMKQLRQLLLALKQDQLVRSRKRMETSADGRVSKYDYYYINYEVFVNVVKYKLDSMQHRLEREQREFTARAAFHCTACGKAFRDLEVDQLMDFATGELKCSFCSGEVVEEENMATRQDLRLTVAKFHEQVRDPLDALLTEIERFRLGPALLEPPIPDALQLGGGDSAGSASNASLAALGLTSGGGGGQSGTTITVDMAAQDSQDGGGSSGAAVKEVPQWLLGSSIAPDEDSNSRFSTDAGAGGAAATSGSGDAARKEEIQDLLILHEVPQKKPQQQQQQRAAAAGPAAAAVAVANAKTKRKPGGRRRRGRPAAATKDDDDDEEEESVRSSTSPTTTDDSDDGPSASKRIRAATAAAAASGASRADSEDDGDDDEDEEEEEEEDDDDSDDDDLTVAFQGDRVPYDEVTEEMVQQMTPAEKQEYATVGQKYYAQLDY